jgi:hypothetical protein
MADTVDTPILMGTFSSKALLLRDYRLNQAVSNGGLFRARDANTARTAKPMLPITVGKSGEVLGAAVVSFSSAIGRVNREVESGCGAVCPVSCC